MKIQIAENERIDDLEIKGYKLIQEKQGFCFGIDAVLLSDFSFVKKGGKCLDLCSGSGIVPILMEAKEKGKKFCALEIQDKYYNLLKRNIVLNNLDNKIEAMKGDLRDYKKIYKSNTFDSITINPPYMKSQSGYKNEQEDVFIARHEIMCNLNDIAECAFYCLKDKGHFYMIHRPERLNEIVKALSEKNIEIKKLRFVHSFVNSKASMVLIDAVKSAKSGVEILNPLIIYKQENVYSQEILRIYQKD